MIGWIMQKNLITPINFEVDIERLKYDSAKALEKLSSLSFFENKYYLLPLYNSQ